MCCLAHWLEKARNGALCGSIFHTITLILIFLHFSLFTSYFLTPSSIKCIQSPKSLRGFDRLSNFTILPPVDAIERLRSTRSLGSNLSDAEDIIIVLPCPRPSQNPPRLVSTIVLFLRKMTIWIYCVETGRQEFRCCLSYAIRKRESCSLHPSSEWKNPNCLPCSFVGYLGQILGVYIGCLRVAEPRITSVFAHFLNKFFLQK